MSPHIQSTGETTEVGGLEFDGMQGDTVSKPLVRFLPQGALKFEGEFEERICRNMNL